MSINFQRISKGITLALVAAPGTPEDGDVWYDSSDNKFKFHQDGTTIEIGTGSGGASFVGTAGENLTAGDALYISVGAADGSRTAGRVYKLDPTNDLRYLFIGVAGATVSSGAAVTVSCAGQVTGLSSLVAGQIVWGSVTTPGGYQTSAPTVKGQWVVPVGVADSTTSFVIDDIGAIAAFKLSHRKTEDINYVLNSTFEDSVAGYSLYADAAGTSPVDGTGGSPTGVTFTRSVTSPLRNLASADLAKDAANRQGTGVSYDFTIDAADQAKVLEVSFDYRVLSGTFVAGTPTTDSDITVHLYDVTNAVLIPLSTRKLFSSSTTVADRFSGYFQTPYNSTSYRLIFHIGSTSASAYTLKIDNVQVKPSVYVYGTPITDWVSYVPTGSWVTNTTYTGLWRRVGDTMEIQVRAGLTGAPTNTSLSVNGPSGYTTDTNKLLASNKNPIVGIAQVYDDSANFFFNAQVLYTTTTSVTLVYQSSLTGQQSGFSATAPITFANNDYVQATYSVPILGWSSSVQMSDSADTRVCVAVQFGAGSGAGGAVITFPNVAVDTHGALSSSRFRVPVSGYYEVEATLNGTNTTNLVNLYVNGSSDLLIGRFSAGGIAQGAVTLRANAGDLLDVRCAGSTGTLSGDSSVSFKRVTGPSAIAATETIAARYASSAGQSIPNTPSVTVVDFGTKQHDTHGAVTTGGAWKFTAPAYGIYRVSAALQYGTQAGWDANEAAEMYLYKNGAQFSVLGAVSGWATTSTSMSISGSDEIELLAGDTIDIRAFQNSGASKTLNASVTSVHVAISRI